MFIIRKDLIQATIFFSPMILNLHSFILFLKILSTFLTIFQAMPHEFSAWQTTGLWDRNLQHLVKVKRRRAGRNQNPTCAIIDSQSIDTAYASDSNGYDWKYFIGQSSQSKASRHQSFFQQLRLFAYIQQFKRFVRAIAKVLFPMLKLFCF